MQPAVRTDLDLTVGRPNGRPRKLVWTIAIGGWCRPAKGCTLALAYEECSMAEAHAQAHDRATVDEAGIQRLDHTKGRVAETLELPTGADPTNLCIGDGGLYVTLGLGGKLVWVDYPTSPAPLLP